jgi:hypothetical protein
VNNFNQRGRVALAATVVACTSCTEPADLASTARPLALTSVSTLLPTMRRYEVGAYIGARALDGEWGAYHERVDGAERVFVLQRTGRTWNTRTIVESPVPRNFGRAIAIGGDVLAIGAPEASEGGAASAGAVYVYVRDGLDWVFQQRLVSDVPVEDAALGTALAIDGDTIVAGASEYPGDSFNQGALYVFSRTGDTWTQSALLRAPDPATGAFFGATVALQGDLVVAGAPSHAHVLGERGAVYAFTRDDTTWTSGVEIVPSQSNNWAYFGDSLALEGDDLVVKGGTGDVNEGGVVYAFTRSGIDWQEAQVIADAVNADGFDRVALSGDTLMAVDGQDLVHVYGRDGAGWTPSGTVGPVGAYSHGGLALDGDAAWFSVTTEATIGPGDRLQTFAREDAQWTRAARVRPHTPDAATGDQFGASLDATNRLIIVGAPGFDFPVDPPRIDSGAAYVTTRFGAGWEHFGRLVYGGEAGARFGAAVGAPDSERLFVGAPGTDGETGEVHQFNWNGSDWAYGRPWSGTGLTGSRYGSAMDSVDGLLAIGEPGGGLTGGGSISVKRRTFDWTGPDMAPDGLEPGDEFGVAVAIDSVHVVGGAPGVAGTGAVHVYSVDGAFQQTITAADGEAGDRFGAAVDLDGGLMVVGAPGRDGATAGDVGAAYVLALQADVWQPVTTLEPATSAAGGAFGSAVAIRGIQVAAASAGARPIEIFRREDGVWTRIDQVTYPGDAAAPGFGAAVELGGPMVLAGAPGDDGIAQASGAAYMFEEGSPACTTCEPDASPLDGSPDNSGSPDGGASPDGGNPGGGTDGNDPDSGEGCGCDAGDGSGGGTALFLFIGMLRVRRLRRAARRSSA